MLAPHIAMILLLTGLATAGAIGVFLAPGMMMRMLFGQTPADTLSILIARHWGLLICLVGVLLIYASFHAEFRLPALIAAIVEKAVFAFGVFFSPFRRRPAVLVMALADTGMAALYLIYLIGL